jgi:hypothetical protein
VSTDSARALYIVCGSSRDEFRVVPGLQIPELVENRRRSIAMLPSVTPALNRDETLELLEQLQAGAAGTARRTSPHLNCRSLPSET